MSIKDAPNMFGGSDPTFGGTGEQIAKFKYVKQAKKSSQEMAKTARTHGQAETTDGMTSLEDPAKKDPAKKDSAKKDPAKKDQEGSNDK